MEHLRQAIYQEIFLSLYDKWQIGKYYSSRGLLDIEDMSENHLRNAIESLKEKQLKRTAIICDLMPDGDIIDQIKASYQNDRDILSLKIRELKRELAYRES